MNTGNTGETAPVYVVAPGEILEEWLEEHGMTQRELALRLGVSPKFANQLVKGVATLSQETAVKLELVTGIPAYVWNRLEGAFREKDARANVESSSAAAFEAIVDALPLATLRGWGYVTGTRHDLPKLAHEVLDFFGVASPEALQGACLSPQGAFRTSRALQVDPWALAAWMRVGELHSREVATEPFTRSGLLDVVQELASKSRMRVEEYSPEIRAMLAKVGVAVVYVPEIPGTRCYGVTRWEGPQRAVIQLSIRGKSDDQFWFTLMHEVSHVLDGYSKQPFVDERAPRGSAPATETSAPEVRADKFATDSLIPPERAPELRTISSLADVEAFAESVGIAPGIVVGRLQHDGLKPYNWGNGLRVRLKVGSAA
jgi:HTH-type transcriptional regulator/antitoxin HigA